MSAKKYGVHRFSFGQNYQISYVGITFSEEFIFTRKGSVEMKEIQDGKMISARRISKRALKQLLNSNAVRWVSKMNEYY